MTAFIFRAGAWQATVLAAGSVALGASAAAQPVGDRLETEPIAGVTLVLAPGSGDSEGPREAVAALYEVELGGRAEYILDNGTEIGGRLVWRAQRDHPNRPGGSGSPLAGGGQVVGAFSGLSTADAAREAGPRGSLESAFIYVSGGYGEISLGRDTGVATRFQEGNVDVFTMARATDTRLDPGGISIVRTRADLTGPAEKLSYTTPRLLGVRGGLSYTPEAERAGLDRNPVSGADGLARAGIENAWEAGLNVSRRLRESGVRLRGALGYVRADLAAPAGAGAVKGSVEAVSVGGEITHGDLRLGASHLQGDDGLETGDYSAWSLGAAYGLQDWTVSLTVAASEAESVGLEGEAISFGVSREIGKNGTFTVGYQDFDTKLSSSDPGNRANRGGIVIELSLSL